LGEANPETGTWSARWLHRLGRFADGTGTELPDYWNVREKIVHVLDFLAAFDQMAAMKHWRQDAESAC
jgi:hypothetical protein